jgi:hypothetical protein
MALAAMYPQNHVGFLFGLAPYSNARALVVTLRAPSGAQP